MTFEVHEVFEKSKTKNEVLFMDKDNELEELEKLMEDQVQTRENPKEEVKLTKPRALIPMIFEVFSFTTLKIQDKWVCEREELISSDEEDDQEIKEVHFDGMEIDKKGLAQNQEKNSNDENSQGVKRKLGAYDKQTNKENTKEVYIRWGQAYKIRWKKQ